MISTAQKVMIDGVEYAVSELNDEAKGQLMNLRVTDQEIARLQTQVAIAQTARAAYARALSDALPKVAADTPAAESGTTKVAADTPAAESGTKNATAKKPATKKG